MSEPSEAAAQLAEMIGGQVEAEPTAPSSDEEANAETPQAQQDEHEETPEEDLPELPTFQPVDEEEFQDEEEMVEETDDQEEQDEVFAYEDETEAEVAKLRKQLNYQKKLRAQDNSKRWAAEAGRRGFTLANLDGITAMSKRAYMREAARSHNENHAVLKPHLDALGEAYKTLKERALADARKEAGDRWGRPASAHSSGSSAGADLEAQLEEARRSGDLAKVYGIIRQQAEAAKK